MVKMLSVVDGKKKCCDCHEWLSVDNFDTYNKNGKTYYQSKCKPCRKIYNTSKEVREKNKIQQEKNKEKYKETAKRYNQSKRGREVRRKASKKYWDANSKKNSARKKVRTALRNGSMVRPNKCSMCGKQCKPEAHHEDYNKPLDIIWVCKSCHTNIHYSNKK